MKKIFSSIMAGFTKGMSEDKKKTITDFGEKIPGMCSCMTGKEMTEEERKAMAELRRRQGDDTESFFKRMGSQTEKTDKPENS